jgi:tetratricopeptide (TPR) repeat protein
MQQSSILLVTAIILVVINITNPYTEAAYGDILPDINPATPTSIQDQGHLTPNTPVMAITSANKRNDEAFETKKSLVRALVLVREERLADALGILDLCPSSSSFRYELNLLRGAILASLQQWTEAIGDCQSALQHRPDSVRALVLLGDALVATCDTHAGIAAYTRALALDPEDAMAYLGRGFAWGEFNEIERSLTDINKGFELLQKRHKTNDVELATWREIAKEICPGHWPDGGTDKFTFLEHEAIN